MRSFLVLVALIAAGSQVLVRRVPPTLLSLSPSSGIVGASVVVAGRDFGTAQENTVIRVNGVTATATAWSDTSATITIPTTTTGSVTMTRGGLTSNALAFTVTTSSITCTTTTADANLATVADAIAAASSGSTVCVAAGTVTWASALTLTQNSKAIRLIGAAGYSAGTTAITCSGRCVYISSNTTATVANRVAYFTLTSSQETFQLDSDGGGQAVRGFRLDHIIRPNGTGAIIDFMAGWGVSTSAMKGLIDHNTIYDGRVVWFGEPDTTGGRYRWSENDDLGTDEAVYVEDNLFETSSNGLSNSVNQIDGRDGSRYVVRFNTFDHGRVEGHGVQGNTTRAIRMAQFYYNDFVAGCVGTKIFRYFFIRGGTVMIFGNRTDGCATENAISLDIARTHQGSTDPVFAAQVSVIGPCDGASVADRNDASGEGYVCMDQPGSSKDTSRYDFSGQHTQQTSRPWYLWRNTRTDDGTDIGWALSCVGTAPTCTRQSTKQIVGNRDIFTYTTGFNGTTGVGDGLLASRPATCTTGVGYFATDQGSWNSSASNPYGVNAAGADGVFYRCTSTDTWTSDWTPYAYPHPLQAS